MTLKVLVTGGCGFIGSHFVEHTLKNRPHDEVIVFDKMTYAAEAGRELVQSLGVRVIEGNIADGISIQKALENVDLVVNFAAETHNDNSILRPQEFFDTNVMGTLELAKACLSSQARLHHVSTDEVFGDLPLAGGGKFTESSPYRPSSPYSASKAAADHIVRSWVRTFGLKATISNCSNNFGPRQHSEKLIPKTIETLRSGGIATLYGSGNNIRDWIHVLDHVEGIWAVIDHGEIGSTYLLGASCEKTNLEVVGMLNEIWGYPADRIEFVNDRPGHDLRYAIDWSRANKDLGWAPKRLDMRSELASLR